MKQKLKKCKSVLRFSAPFAWMGIIFFLSSRQRLTFSENYLITFLFFKTLHIIEYGILFLLWRIALYDKKEGVKLAILISALYAIADELHQVFVPTREGSIRDVLIDFLGIFIFWKFLLQRFEDLARKMNLIKEKEII